MTSMLRQNDHEHPNGEVAGVPFSPARGPGRQPELVPGALASVVRSNAGSVGSSSDVPAIAAGLEALDSAALLLERSGRPIFVNARAAALLRQADAICLDAAGVLRCRDRGAQGRLADLLAQAVQPGPADGASATRVFAIPSRNGRALAGLLRPVPHYTEAGAEAAAPDSHCAILLVRDPQQELDNCAERVAAVFGLSEAEAQVVGRLAAGASLEEIADQRSVRLVTVRNQVKSVQSKMGVPRQAELVSLVLRTVQF